jgi:hypothetical protein
LKEVLRYIISSSINIRPLLFPQQDNLTLEKDYQLADRTYYSDCKVIGYTRYSVQFSTKTTTHKHNKIEYLGTLELTLMVSATYL